MSPINFENQLKSKLEKRTISPSQDSWETLENQLNKKRSFSYKKLLLVASIIGIIVTISLNFKNGKNTVNPTIVTTDSIPKKITSEEEYIVENETFEELKTTSEIKSNTSTIKKIEKEIPIKKTAKNLKKPETVIAVISSNSFETKIAENSIIPEEKDTLKIDLDKEVETLLANAQIEILIKNGQDSMIVDYNSLLEEAEFELEIDNSLKNKLFKAIVNNYQSVKNTKSNNKKQ